MVQKISQIKKFVIAIFAIVIVLLAGSVTLSFSNIEPFSQIFPKKSSDQSQIQEQNSDILTIAIYSDSQNDTVHQKIVNDILSHHPDYVFHGGDLVNDGNSQSQWNTFNAITAQLRAEALFYPALGNHEMNSPLYYNNFELPNNERWYSVDTEYFHFIILDSNTAMGAGSEQYAWLVNDLQNADENNKFIFVVFHHPIYTSRSYSDDADKVNNLVPLFETYGVDAVFNGHVHSYERLVNDNVLYFITGSAGGTLRDKVRTHPYSKFFLKTYGYFIIKFLDGNMILTFYDDNNNLIDQIRLTLQHVCT